MPCGANVSSICLAAGVWRGAFFLGARRWVLGTPPSESVACVGGGLDFAGVGACLRELKEDMNSID